MQLTKSFRIIATLTSIVILLGCANRLVSPITKTNEQQTQRTEKIFLGIPGVLSFEGSAVRLNEEWMLTAKHNFPILSLRKEVHYHPRCDLALYRDPTDEPFEDVKIGTVYSGEPIQATGYPMYYPLTTTHGTFDLNVKLTFNQYENCTFSAGGFGVMSGMSGGGIWHSETGHLVGITHGFAIFPVKEYGLVGLFVALQDLDEWFIEVTGKSFLTEKHKPKPSK
ncbi:hypothetical protein F7U66_01840 [Vibrio parahaemolyticus]|nr:hypothetical protein [Vibrio parahaemolyticus]